MLNETSYPSDLFIDLDLSMLEGLKQMDASGRKLLIVVKEGKFFSLLSIGDLQRAIIKNLPMFTPINAVLRKDIYVATDKDELESIKSKMVEYRAEFMPIIDSSNTIVKILFWKDIFKTDKKRAVGQFNTPVVIMAGGLGSRLKPLTNVLPKPLIPIGEKTIIEHIFDRFAVHGCMHYFISVNYKAELIEYYLNELQLNYDLHFLKEGKPLGTAGSLSLLKGNIKSTFFVTNCDILIEQDYHEILEYHQENKNELTIVAALKHYPIPYGIVETAEHGILKSISEKPELTFKINSGMYILEPHVLQEIPDDQFYHITHLIEKIKLRGGKVGVFPVSDNSWKDIGEWNEYQKLITTL